mmetsp:Transcript_60373/g.139191  ORF Transcript_60373/g.139191 Transcript_60373/m.139191 type:complete len:183 (+) Transcript_60373:30-578(+)
MSDLSALLAETQALRTEVAVKEARIGELESTLKSRQEAVEALEALATDMHTQMAVASTATDLAAARKAGEELDKLRLSLEMTPEPRNLDATFQAPILAELPKPDGTELRGAVDSASVAAQRRITELEARWSALDRESLRQQEEILCLKAELELAERSELDVGASSSMDRLWNLYGLFGFVVG